MTSIKQLTDKNGEPFFPVTHIDAVFDSNGNNIADKLDIDIFEKDTENTKYITENSMKEFNCEQDGYLTNIFLEGETVVNHFARMSWLDSSYGVKVECTEMPEATFFIDDPIDSLRPDREYTIVFDMEMTCSSFEIHMFSTRDDRHSVIANGNTSRRYAFKFTPFDNNIEWSFRFDANELGYAHFKNVMLLEGDYVERYNLGYINGLRSVGNLDYTVSNGNYEIDKSRISFITYKYEHNLLENCTLENDTMVTWSLGDEYNFFNYKATDYIEIEPNEVYTFLGCNLNVAFYDADKVYIQMPLGGKSGLDNNYFSHKAPSNAKYLRVSLYKNYINPVVAKNLRTSKTTINKTLRSLPNGIKDTIEKINDKYYLIKRCGEYIINSAANYSIGSVRTNVIHHCIGIDDIKRGYAGFMNMYCDKYKVEPTPEVVDNFSDGSEYGHEFISYDLNKKQIVLGLAKDKVNSQDANAFDTYVKNNPIKIVYQLEFIEVIESPNLDIQTFEGETVFLAQTNAIHKECSFEVSNSFGSSYDMMKDKLDHGIDYILRGLDEVFQLGNSVKDDLVAALIAKNINATNQESFKSLIEKVNNITQGQGNATESKVVQGYTFTNSDGILRTGTLPERGYYTPVSNIYGFNGDTLHMGIPEGAYIWPTSSGTPEIIINRHWLIKALSAGQFIFNTGNGFIMGGGLNVSGQANAVPSLSTGTGNQYLRLINNIYSTTNCYAYFSTKNDIDWTRYSRFCIQIDYLYNDLIINFAGRMTPRVNTTGLTTIDISQLTGATTFQFEVGFYNSSSRNYVQISKIWLE